MSAPPAKISVADTGAKKSSRKRRRRQQSYEPSSASSSESDGALPLTSRAGPHVPKLSPSGPSSSESPSSSSSSSGESDGGRPSTTKGKKASSPSSSSSSSNDGGPKRITLHSGDGMTAANARPPEQRRYPTLSPTPPPRAIPSFLVGPSATDATADEETRRERFRRVYMDKLVEGFGSDLEKLRAADPGMSERKLKLLIDCMKAGTEVYRDAHDPNARKGEVDEVGVVLGEL